MTRPIDGPAGGAADEDPAGRLVSVPTSRDDRGRPTEWQLVDPDTAAHWDTRRWQPLN